MRKLVMLAAILAATPVAADPVCEPKPVTDGSVHGIRAIGVPLIPGVLVTKVTPDSAASCAGVRPGDWILEVNDTRIDDDDDLERALGSHAASARLEVRRPAGTTTLSLAGASNAEASKQLSLKQLMTDWIRALMPRANKSA